MPTTRPRIPVIEDAALAEALEEARRLLGSGRSKASLVRELALLGSRELAAEQQRRRAAAEDLRAMIDEGRLDFDAALALREIEPFDG